MEWSLYQNKLCGRNYIAENNCYFYSSREVMMHYYHKINMTASYQSRKSYRNRKWNVIPSKMAYLDNYKKYIIRILNFSCKIMVIESSLEEGLLLWSSQSLLLIVSPIVIAVPWSTWDRLQKSQWLAKPIDSIQPHI